VREGGLHQEIPLEGTRPPSRSGYCHEEERRNFRLFCYFRLFRILSLFPSYQTSLDFKPCQLIIRFVIWPAL
jgi:hypothetical protein